MSSQSQDLKKNKNNKYNLLHFLVEQGYLRYHHIVPTSNNYNWWNPYRGICIYPTAATKACCYVMHYFCNTVTACFRMSWSYVCVLMWFLCNHPPPGFMDGPLRQLEKLKVYLGATDLEAFRCGSKHPFTLTGTICTQICAFTRLWLDRSLNVKPSWYCSWTEVKIKDVSGLEIVLTGAKPLFLSQDLMTSIHDNDRQKGLHLCRTSLVIFTTQSTLCYRSH